MNIEPEKNDRKRSFDEESPSSNKRSQTPSQNSFHPNLFSGMLQTGNGHQPMMDSTISLLNKRDEFLALKYKGLRDDFVTNKRKKLAKLEPVDLPQKRSRDDLAPFVYDTGKQEKLDNQVKYGPKATLDKKELTRLSSHFGGDVGERFTQYSNKRKDYVDAAEKANRPLTLQEHDVKMGKDPGSTSINHIIASGTGQNMFNRMTLQFLDGEKSTRKDNIQKATASVESGKGGFEGLFANAEKMRQRTASRKEVLKGLAQQAAAVGRMTGVGREILKEESADQGYGKKSHGAIEHEGKRNAMMKDVLNAFQGKHEDTRMNSYKSFMKNTFDSTGNLRLGNGKANGRVSTGFDMPLNADLKPTQRGLRLLEAHETFGMPNMLDGSKKGSGIFTTTKSGKLLTSSIEKKK
ncbi:MAG TPA: hypothetical protein VEC06_16225 [Paucimonas sp.]|nr:hypothetical protein [Paucimonas sp.]